MSLDDLQAQLRGALDQQFAALKHQYELSIEEARRDAAAEAEREFAAKLDLARAEYHQARTEWESQLQELVIAARADAEQCAAQAAAVERQEYQQHLQAQLEQRVEQAAAAAQRSAALEQEAERRRAQSEIEAAREQAKAEVDAERQRLQQEVDAERQRAQQERDVERQRLQQELAAARQRLQQEREAERAQAEQAAQQEREVVRQQIQQAAQQEREAERQQIQQEREAERQQTQQERDAERQQVQQERDAERQHVQQERDVERQQLKQLLMAERQKMQQQLAADGERARQEVEALTARHQAELAAAKQAAATAAAAAATATAAAATNAAATAAAAKAAIPGPAGAPATGVSPAAFDRVLAAISDLDGTHTLAAALDLLLAHSGAVAGRAALFLIDGDRLRTWKSSGIPDADARTVASPIAGTDLLARAIQTGRATPSSSELPAPPFAKLPADRVGLAVPVMIGGRAVAVLYADSGAKPAPPGSDATIELLARHTSTVVALRTAMRTLDVLRGVPADTPNGHADEQSARRFAKLLISEIKLYNEPAVRAGRQQRDLRQRLRSEIDRAQRLYEERVPPGVNARSSYFQQELVQTLADGDATLLGSA